MRGDGKDPAALPAAWEEQRAKLLPLLDAIRGSVAGASVEPYLVAVERSLQGLDDELAGGRR